MGTALVPNFVRPLFACPMNPNPKFGPSAQTPEQRAWVLAQMQIVLPRLKTKATAYAQQLYARYVAGDLTWLEVHQALEAAQP